MSDCIRCGRHLDADEIGLHRKIVNRGATEFMCISCLADEFGVSEELLRNKIEEFREMGCMLFAGKE